MHVAKTFNIINYTLIKYHKSILIIFTDILKMLPNTFSNIFIKLDKKILLKIICVIVVLK